MIGIMDHWMRFRLIKNKKIDFIYSLQFLSWCSMMWKNKQEHLNRSKTLQLPPIENFEIGIHICSYSRNYCWVLTIMFMYTRSVLYVQERLSLVTYVHVLVTIPSQKLGHIEHTRDLRTLRAPPPTTHHHVISPKTYPLINTQPVLP